MQEDPLKELTPKLIVLIIEITISADTILSFLDKFLL